jgi:signal transduction histidine kinase
MSKTGIQQRDDRLFSRIALFWCAVMAGLLVVSGIQTASDDPGVLHSWNGLLTGALALAYGAWFLYLLMLRYRWRPSVSSRLGRGWIYLLLTVGVALTVALSLLHAEFVGLVFADMGVLVFAVDGWISLLPVAFLGGLFLYLTGAPRSGAVPQIGGELLSLVSIVALVYTLATVMRQRVERDRLIAELQEAHQQLRRTAARDVELAALRERNRLAREMHDSLGHALVLIAIKIEAAQRLQAVDPARAAAEWEATKALVRSTMSDLRSSLAGLRLPALEEQPFRAAVAELAAELERSADVEVVTEIPDEADDLGRDLQEALYRVAQEALANVARHAHARHAWITLSVEGDAAQLMIEDDGVGLDASPRSDGAHYGVVGMRERVEGLSGVFTLGPRPGGGTRLRAAVPLKEGVDVRRPFLPI